MNKPSADIPEQQKTVPDESHPVDQPQHSTDENGIRFLVYLFEDIFKKGSNLTFGNDVFKFSLQSEEKKFFVEIIISLLLSQTIFTC